ncbi:response regulator transcription factor [Fulvivirga maritima]|uniref:LytR/AlgR family response regulator transcription factor n=1 Tax=Fulvivirga maritima TaxID=2904247 RepID=UPI001F29DF24|nr:response regulator transcription factor [Fulvivirga maritima]UII26727.1 response regulator transcription factor [Fulvivirga maritima]
MDKYLIIDDEPVAHEIIKSYCDKLPYLSLAAQCYDAFEALEYLKKHSVDLIFLDLNMPQLKGFDFLRSLAKPPKIIVTTAYQEYAVEGYELDIIDYLLKPFSFERFLKAVNKALQTDTPLTRNDSPIADHIFLYEDKKHIQVKLNEILFIEASGNYCKVILENSQLLTRTKISEILQKLPDSRFIQVHKSFIISKEKVDCITGNIVTIGQHIIPIGKLFKPQVDGFLKG